MSKARLMQSVIIMILLFPAYAFAENETKDYTVTKGDTLWGISGKELSDSFLWPKVWKENPQITNPDRLYPGQSIRIPLYLTSKSSEEVAPPAVIVTSVPARQIKKEEPVPAAQPLVDRNVLVGSGYIASSLPGVGLIDGSPAGRNLLGNGDIVYLKTAAPADPGQRYYVIKVQQEVRHPVTHKKAGFLLQIVGVAEVLKHEFGYTRAKIIQGFGEIDAGDLLDNYYEVSPPVIDRPFRRPDLNGVVLASENLKIMSTKLDVVFLDKGKNDGIKAGDMFRIVGKNDGHFISGGVVQVINESDTTSAALVQNASEPITAGNAFTHLE